MKKIALIVQRYGLEVNGGAEYHCRILAEQLKSIYQVDVLTSCALDYVDWANYYPEGKTIINDIQVIRFPTLYKRQDELFAKMTKKLSLFTEHKKHIFRDIYYKLLPLVRRNTIRKYSKLWTNYQGPYMPGLLDYLKNNHQQYDAFIFFTYLYYPTIEGLKIVPSKSILIPTAHDEPPIYLPVFDHLFLLPKAILYNSISEKQFINQKFHNESIYSDIVGVGIEPFQGTIHHSVAELLKTDAPYLIYIGRIDPAKGCDILLDYFTRYKERYPSQLKLVIVGKAFMPLPEHPDIIPMGFVEEEIKVTLLKQAKALVIPSLFESLSMVTLESFSYGIPVIANAHCEVLKDHIELSEAGFLYRDEADFDKAVDSILADKVEGMATKAMYYVSKHYTWSRIIEKVAKAVDYVTAKV
ncbi:MAG: glycosyltransferase family 4 protein [Siphonobacter sp.]